MCGNAALPFVAQPLATDWARIGEVARGKPFLSKQTRCFDPSPQRIIEIKILLTDFINYTPLEKKIPFEKQTRISTSLDGKESVGASFWTPASQWTWSKFVQGSRGAWFGIAGSMFTDAPRSLFSFHPPSKRGWKREGDVERPRAIFRDLWIRLRSTLNANFHDDILDKKASSWGGRETKRRKEGRKGVFPRRKNINSKRESVLLDARDRGWLGRLENW